MPLSGVGMAFVGGDNMVQINDINIFSVDRNDDSWAIEGEIEFESDLTVDFSVTYLTYEDELEDLELEVNPGRYDKDLLKEMILNSVNEYCE